MVVEYAVIKPVGFRIPVESTRIPRISHEEAVRNGKPIAVTLRRFLKQIREHNVSLLVAHNMKFDRPILLAEMIRCGLPDSIANLSTFCTMIETVDLCCLPRTGYGGFKWPTLDELHRKLFRRAFDGSHHARNDVLACAKCFFKLEAMGHLNLSHLRLPKRKR